MQIKDLCVFFFKTKRQLLHLGIASRRLELVSKGDLVNTSCANIVSAAWRRRSLIYKKQGTRVRKAHVTGYDYVKR